MGEQQEFDTTWLIHVSKKLPGPSLGFSSYLFFVFFFFCVCVFFLVAVKTVGNYGPSPQKGAQKQTSQCVAQTFKGSLTPLRTRARSPSLDDTLSHVSFVGFTPTKQKLVLLPHPSVGGTPASTPAPSHLHPPPQAPWLNAHSKPQTLERS